MARRTEYTTALKCECGNAGTITREENENPVYHGDGGTFVSLSGSFTRIGDKVVCDKCRGVLANA